jgi:uncharacterized protein YegL
MGSPAEEFDAAPFVLAIDRSSSMQGAIDAVNAVVPQIIDTMRDIPEALESAALGVVSFNNIARVNRRITWLDEDITIPRFAAESRTSYVEPLERVRELIAEDVPQLGQRGWRPVVFFITDGQPNEETEAEWLAARGRLLDAGFKLRPKIAALGFGNVDFATLRRLASEPSLAEYNGADASVAIREILAVVLRTIITLTAGTAAKRADDLAGRILDEERKPISYE